MFLETQVDLTKTKNLILVSVILVIGCSWAMIPMGPSSIDGMSLATIAGIGINRVFILFERIGLSNEGN